MKQRTRGLLILALGAAFLIAITLIGTSLESLLSRRSSSPTQTQSSASYEITLQVAPNPPLLTQPTELALRIVHLDTQQLVTDAQVEIDASMEAMDMAVNRFQLNQQPNTGQYSARFQFTMSGAWQLRVTITQPDQTAEQVIFEVIAQ